MNKNIKQNFFLKVKKVLDEVDKSHPMWVRGLKQGSK